jgi:hypothetical protein
MQYIQVTISIMTKMLWHPKSIDDFDEYIHEEA